MKSLLVFAVLLFLGVNSCGQKFSAYKYGDVDTLWLYLDAQIVYYKNKDGKRKQDTIWYAKLKKDVEIDWAHCVITASRFLKPRIKITPKEIKN